MGTLTRAALEAALDDWISRTAGTRFDYWGTPGNPSQWYGECVQLANVYQRDVLHGAFVGTPLTGGAADWWNDYDNNPATQATYERLPADAAVLPGDVPVWEGMASNGWAGHIAVASFAQPDGAAPIPCYSQNPNPAGIMPISRQGLLGILRPRLTTPPTHTEGADCMKLVYVPTKNGKAVYLLTCRGGARLTDAQAGALERVYGAPVKVTSGTVNAHKRAAKAQNTAVPKS